MAKYRSAFKVSGKLGEHVFIDSKTGKHIRTVPTLTDEQRAAKAELPQNKKPKIINKLASAVNVAVEEIASFLKESDLYTRLLKIFWAQKTDNPLLLLHSLRDAEINGRYVFSQCGSRPQITVTPEKRAYLLEAEFSPHNYRLQDNDSIYLEFMLIVLNGEDHTIRSMSRATAWVRTAETKKKCVSMDFRREATDIYYLTACRVVFGVNCVDHDDAYSARMRFFGGDALSAAGKELIAGHAAMLKEMEAEKNRPGVAKVRERVEVRDVE